MSVVLDQVLTLAIGRNGQDGKPMSSYRWHKFQAKARSVIEQSATVVAHTMGRGVGSDNVNEYAPEDSAIIVAINPTNVELIREQLALLLPKYGQGSAAFAFDREHEPVFATKNGYRTA